MLIDADTVIYLKQDKPKPLVLFEVVKGMITGRTADIAEPRRLDLGSEASPSP